MLSLEDILGKEEITQLKSTRNIKSSYPRIFNWFAQTMIWIPWTYEWAVKGEAKFTTKEVENPLKTILIISWLTHLISEGKLTYDNKPIRIKLDDYLEHHLWDFSLRTEHYTMCIETLYMVYQDTHKIESEHIYPDQLRIYPALKSDKPKLKGKQRSYLKVSNQICQKLEKGFSQHNLYLPNPPQDYNPLSSKDVNEWLNLILKSNDIDPLQTSNEIQSHVAEVQAIWQRLNYEQKQRNSGKEVQPVLLRF